MINTSNTLPRAHQVRRHAAHRPKSRIVNAPRRPEGVLTTRELRAEVLAVLG
jgi:hypothetical protein